MNVAEVKNKKGRHITHGCAAGGNTQEVADRGYYVIPPGKVNEVGIGIKG
jgi:hypothetical protein